MSRQWLRASGYLAIFLMPALFVVGCSTGRTWLAFGTVVIVFPLARTLFGSVPAQAAPEWDEGVATVLDRLPIIYGPVLIGCVVTGLWLSARALGSNPPFTYRAVQFLGSTSPVLLRSGRGEGLIYILDVEKIPRGPGVYVFARCWGKSFEALYVGKSMNVRGRVRSHLNRNVRLMRHLEDAKSGPKVVVSGYPITKPGQRIEKVLSLLERGLIRHFLSEAHDLVNQQGTRIRRHSIESTGRNARAFIPSLMYLERTRGE